jgi:hypothetical protein
MLTHNDEINFIYQYYFYHIKMLPELIIICNSAQTSYTNFAGFQYNLHGISKSTRLEPNLVYFGCEYGF